MCDPVHCYLPSGNILLADNKLLSSWIDYIGVAILPHLQGVRSKSAAAALQMTIIHDFEK